MQRGVQIKELFRLMNKDITRNKRLYTFDVFILLVALAFVYTETRFTGICTISVNFISRSNVLIPKSPFCLLSSSHIVTIAILAPYCTEIFEMLKCSATFLRDSRKTDAIEDLETAQ